MTRAEDKEKAVEKFLVQSVITLRGLCFKLKFLGFMGAPDRLVLLPPGRLYFVELKTNLGALEDSQKIMFARLAARGFPVQVLHGRSEVEAFIENVLKETL